RLDDDLLPHRPAWEVVDVVHLVEHDVTDQVEARGVFVDEVAQDLRRHHDDRRVVVDRVLAGHETDRAFAVGADEVVILLIAQRLERSGVKDFPAVSERPEDRVFRHDRLAARGRRADQHPALPTIELLDGFALERIEVEGQRFLELFDQRLDCFHSGTRSVETSVIRAPSACASIYVSAAARTRSAWRASPLTVAIAISASCQRSSSPTSAAATFSS